MVAATDGLHRRPRPAAALLLTLAACNGAPVEPMHFNRPPVPGEVRDGIAGDVDEQEVATSLFANWNDFVDPEGLPVVYEWAVGRSPGASDVQRWTWVGGATSASLQGLDLPLGSMLYVSVRATDITGLHSEVATSDGVRLGRPASPGASPNGEIGDGERFRAVERFGITWTFDRPMRCGRFVTGDWWVVGPAYVIAIAPASTDEDGRVRNGSMIDPDPRQPAQGYDSAMFGAEAQGRYDPKSNVAFGIDAERPLRIEPGQSLVSAISSPQAGEMPQLETCAILTCVARVPADDAFRPAYCKPGEQVFYRSSQLDLSRLGKLEVLAGAPMPADLAPRFERPWLDHVSGWTSRYLHPRLNMPDYGRDMANLVGLAALALQLDFELSDKRALVHRLVQLGIDLHGIVAAGGRFVADGGSGSGRKFPILFAGALLQDDAMIALARERSSAFAEDVQTFYVEETAPGVWNRGHGGYGPEDAHLPEWGNQHGDDPRFDQKSWTSDPYRRCCTANVWLGFVLAARVMGLREAWGHDALFDYVDRYLQVETPGTWTRSLDPFAERCWDRFRAQY